MGNGGRPGGLSSRPRAGDQFIKCRRPNAEHIAAQDQVAALHDRCPTTVRCLIGRNGIELRKLAVAAGDCTMCIVFGCSMRFENEHFAVQLITNLRQICCQRGRSAPIRSDYHR